MRGGIARAWVDRRRTRRASERARVASRARCLPGRGDPHPRGERVRALADQSGRPRARPQSSTTSFPGTGESGVTEHREPGPDAARSLSQRAPPGAALATNRGRKHQNPWGQRSRHRRLNVQTRRPRTHRSPFRRKKAPDYVPSSSRSIDRMNCAVGSVQRAAESVRMDCTTPCRWPESGSRAGVEPET